MSINLDVLRRFAVSHSLFPPTTLESAVDRLGFVQADPIRAPARAQDLILRHRVQGYLAGDLERRYESLDLAEDTFINYGFVTSTLQRLMHPRSRTKGKKREQQILEFVLARGSVHPGEVDSHFSLGTVTNYWGGSSNATTQLLDAMHYQGRLRIARREKGIRIYSIHQHDASPITASTRRQRLDSLVDTAVRLYAPVPAVTLSYLVRRLRYAAPQWQNELKNALERARKRLRQAEVDGIKWYWPEDAEITQPEPPETVRLLAPFDPLVWDRARFDILWGWEYRFEAYTPVLKRKRGYYALPLLWRHRVIGWANLAVKDGKLEFDFGYIASQPRERIFKRELEAELHRFREFLSLSPL